MDRVKIAVFVSGNGSNFENIVKSFENSYKAEISFVVSSDEKAYALDRAKRLSVKSYVVNPVDFYDKLGYEKALLKILDEHSIKIVLLSGFFKILSSYFLSNFKGVVLNLHPSYLPEYRGLNAVQRAFEDNVKYSGATVHYVDVGVDTGEIIIQEKVYIEKGETLEMLIQKIHNLEYKIYPVAINKIVDEILKGDINEKEGIDKCIRQNGDS